MWRGCRARTLPQRLNGHPLGHRSLAAAATPGQSRWLCVDDLNETLEHYPAFSFAAHISSSLATFGLAYAALHAVGFDAPAIACAGVVSRLTKRLRMPLDVSLAAAMSHAMPSANRLKLGHLVAAPIAHVQAADGSEPAGRIEQGLVAFTRAVQGPVNTYGGPYVLVHWCTGLATASATTLCVHHGVDVMSMLSSLPLVSLSEGAAQSVSKTASCVGGAMLLNTMLLPFRIVLLGRFGKPAFAELARRQESLSLRIRDGDREYRSWYRRRLRERPETRQLARRAASDASGTAKNGPSATG